MTYAIEYNDRECSSAQAPPPVIVEVPLGSTALDVMEQAVRQKGNDYKFTATYSDFATGQGGFFIDILNGTQNNKEKKCNWILYIRYTDGRLCKSDVGESDAKITPEVAGIVMRFEKY